MTDLHELRSQWTWAGQARPPFAQLPAVGQESVWDYPRPPRIEVDAREVVIRWGTLEVGRSRRAVRVLETSHPPSFYLPWADVDRRFFVPARGSSLCEWKGAASYWTLVDGGRVLANVAWSYPQPFKGSEMVSDRVAFYPADLDCQVDGVAVTAQPGGFYGGWVTPELAGPFKGSPGSSAW